MNIYYLPRTIAVVCIHISYIEPVYRSYTAPIQPTRKQIIREIEIWKAAGVKIINWVKDTLRATGLGWLIVSSENIIRFFRYVYLITRMFCEMISICVFVYFKSLIYKIRVSLCLLLNSSEMVWFIFIKLFFLN